MAKAKNTAFFCSECGYESAKWFGQCPACKAWNTFVEEPIASKLSAKGISAVRKESTYKVARLLRASLSIASEFFLSISSTFLTALIASLLL